MAVDKGKAGLGILGIFVIIAIICCVCCISSSSSLMLTGSSNEDGELEETDDVDPEDPDLDPGSDLEDVPDEFGETVEDPDKGKGNANYVAVLFDGKKALGTVKKEGATGFKTPKSVSKVSMKKGYVMVFADSKKKFLEITIKKKKVKGLAGSATFDKPVKNVKYVIVKKK